MQPLLLSYEDAKGAAALTLEVVVKHDDIAGRARQGYGGHGVRLQLVCGAAGLQGELRVQRLGEGIAGDVTARDHPQGAPRGRQRVEVDRELDVLHLCLVVAVTVQQCSFRARRKKK